MFLYTYVVKTLGEVLLKYNVFVNKKTLIELCLDATANGMSILAKNRPNKLGKKTTDFLNF